MNNKKEPFMEQACLYLAIANAVVTGVAVILALLTFKITTVTVIGCIATLFIGAVVCVILSSLYEILHYINSKKTE